MNPENERIELLFPGRKRCMMLKHQYEIVCEFLFQKLQGREKVTLTELLESAEQNLVNRIKGDLSWTVLQVKQDLEARGLIVISHEKNRVQVISLKKSARKKLNMVGGFLMLKEHAEDLLLPNGKSFVVAQFCGNSLDLYVAENFKVFPRSRGKVVEELLKTKPRAI